MEPPTARVALGAAVLALLNLLGCGGGGSEQGGSIVGVVIDGPIQGAAVCLDLNRNVACEADEPISLPTGPDGRFAIEEITPAQSAAGAPLVADIPATAVDADRPGSPIGTAYRMTTPAGAGQRVISPITTLVQAGIRDGLTPADALTSVAAQTGAPQDRLLQDYTGTPSDPVSRSLADFASASVVPELQAGRGLAVEPPVMNLGSSYTVTRFQFDSNSNYTIGTLSSDGVFVDGLNQYRPVYYEMRNGMAQSTAAYYSGDIFLSDDNVWTTCDSSQHGTVSVGNPRRLGICGTHFVQTVRTEALAGTNMEDVVIDLIETNGSSSWNFDTAPLAGAVFPAGSQRLIRASRRTDDNGRYNPADGVVPGVTTLSELVAAYPVPPGNVVGSNTLSIGSVYNSVGLRLARLRVAFGPGPNDTRYYACEEALTSCSEDGRGTYLTGILGGAPVLLFTGVALDVETDRLFIERDSQIWFGEIAKPAQLRQLSRLNDVAFRALAAQLSAILPVELR